jgi:hypothetical protein
MKVNAFKKLIKEAVAEAVREELQEIFSQQKSTPSPLREMKTVSFTSNDVVGATDIRAQLRAQMGEAFGFSQQSATNNLKVIDAVDPSTGDKVNPYLNFIADAAANMTAADRSGLRQLS